MLKLIDLLQQQVPQIGQTLDKDALKRELAGFNKNYKNHTDVQRFDRLQYQFKEVSSMLQKSPKDAELGKIQQNIYIRMYNDIDIESQLAEYFL